jgi:hypothetical protein
VRILVPFDVRLMDFFYLFSVDGWMQFSECKGIHQDSQEIRQGAS